MKYLALCLIPFTVACVSGGDIHCSLENGKYVCSGNVNGNSSAPVIP